MSLFAITHEVSEILFIDITFFRQIFIRSHISEDLRYIDFINYMIRLEIGLQIRHGGVMRMCGIEDKIYFVVVASYRRNPVRFKALFLVL